MKRLIIKGTRAEVVRRLAELYMERGIRKTEAEARRYAEELLALGVVEIVTLDGDVFRVQIERKKGPKRGPKAAEDE